MSALVQDSNIGAFRFVSGTKEERIQPNELPLSSSVRLISTLPKSGTWALSFFWSCYDALLAGKLQADPYASFWRFDSLGIDLCAIGHMYYPAFAENYRGDDLTRWEHLGPVAVGLDWISPFLTAYGLTTLPAFGKDWKMILVERHPFSQMYSYYVNYRRAYENRDELFLVRNYNGEIVPSENFGEFCRNIGIKSYIKFMFTFDRLGPRLGDRLLWLSFEDMIRNRLAFHHRMIEFFCGPMDERQKLCADLALGLTSSDRLGLLEKLAGATLVDPGPISRFFAERRSASLSEREYSQKHINAGGRAAWRDEIGQADLRYCVAMLKDFGLYRDEFKIA